MQYRSTVRLCAALSLCASLTACLAPKQDFVPASPMWTSANPEFEGTHAPNPGAFKVLVGVLDGGFDYNAPLVRDHVHVFATNRSSGRDYGIGFDVLGKDYFPSQRIINLPGGEDISDDLQMRDHGTHVAQLVTLNDASIGLVPVRVFPLAMEPEDEVSPSDPATRLLTASRDPVFLARVARRSVDAIARGIGFAVSQGASVINMSLGLDLEELLPADRDAVLAQIEQDITARMKGAWAGILMVVAAGNETAPLERAAQAIPATLAAPDLLAVGALSAKGTIAHYSNFGRFVDVYVRGTDIESSIPGGRGKMSGTSMASPLVAHLAAQLKAIDPSLSPGDLRALILNTADVRILAVEPSKPGAVAPVPRKVRVANMLKARRQAKLLLENPADREKWLKAPYEHGKAP
jgi:subtilisin family serine protease